MLHDPKHCSCSTIFNECHVISTVLQLLKLIQFILKKNAICMFVIFPKFCFKQTISVDFFIFMHLRRYDSLFAKFDTIMC